MIAAQLDRIFVILRERDLVSVSVVVGFDLCWADKCSRRVRVGDHGEQKPVAQRRKSGHEKKWMMI